jgi:hypothetical protein
MGLLEDITAEIKEMKLNQERLMNMVLELADSLKPKEDPDMMLDTEAAARILGIRPSTLKKDRVTGKRNIPYQKSGKRVFYRLGDLREYQQRCIRHSTCDPGQKPLKHLRKVV